MAENNKPTKRVTNQEIKGLIINLSNRLDDYAHKLEVLERMFPFAGEGLQAASRKNPTFGD